MKKLISALLAATMTTALLSGCSTNPGDSQSSTAAAQSAAGTETKKDSASAGTDSGWPSKDIQVICPFAAGGDTDYNARQMAQALTDELGVNVIVVNTDGNGGATGARAGKDAANDGYNVLFTSSAFITNQLSGAVDFGFDAFEFCCIAGQGAGNVVCISKDLGVNTFAELIAYSKAHPGELKMAANSGATTQAIAFLIKNVGVDANIVDSGGSSDRIASLLGGQIDIIINSYGSVKDYIDSGDFIALGLDCREVNERMAETGLTTISSQGYDAIFDSYYMFMFPKGTDQAAVQKLSEAVKKVTEENETYAASIGEAFYQVPYYEDRETGLKSLNALLDRLQIFGVQFKS